MAQKPRLLTTEQHFTLAELARATEHYVIGVDEVGLGCIAGPLVVASAMLPKGYNNKDVKDSKAYSSREARERAAVIVRRDAIAYCILAASNEEIDARGVRTVLLDLTRKVSEVCAAWIPDTGAVIVQDGEISVPVKGVRTFALPKGDALVRAVGAASVLAKTYRDTFMVEQAKIYRGYNFQSNVGYGQVAKDALNTLGICPLHRRSYGPVKEFLYAYSSGSN